MIMIDVNHLNLEDNVKYVSEMVNRIKKINNKILIEAKLRLIAGNTITDFR